MIQVDVLNAVGFCRIGFDIERINIRLIDSANGKNLFGKRFNCRFKISLRGCVRNIVSKRFETCSIVRYSGLIISPACFIILRRCGCLVAAVVFNAENKFNRIILRAVFGRFVIRSLSINPLRCQGRIAVHSCRNWIVLIVKRSDSPVGPLSGGCSDFPTGEGVACFADSRRREAGLNRIFYGIVGRGEHRIGLCALRICYRECHL